MLNICVFDDRDPDFRHLHPMLLTALAVVRHSHGHMAWCTTFDPYKFREPDFHADTIRQLDANFLQGAVAVKVWKNVGMELRTPDGNFVMPDDPTFEPIYQDIGAHHKTLIIHAAEPTSCWQPPNPASPDYEYYQHHPEWYMYIHPDHPSKQTILQARDHVLAENPQLRVVGAHLGSMELDVDDIARHFDRYPNFAVDTAARVVYLALQPRDKVRAFIIKYQDRILYGTDLGLAPGQNADSLAYWQSTYDRDWKFFATRETVEYEGHKVQGLDLPRGVLRKLYHDNAARWIPGVLSGTRGP
jgi:predicted TIM-barrel fold metal-dependent hydrolase